MLMPVPKDLYSFLDRPGPEISGEVAYCKHIFYLKGHPTSLGQFQTSMTKCGQMLRSCLVSDTVKRTLINPNPLIVSHHLPKHASHSTRYVLIGKDLTFLCWAFSHLRWKTQYLSQWLYGLAVSTQKLWEQWPVFGNRPVNVSYCCCCCHY